MRRLAPLLCLLALTACGGTAVAPAAPLNAALPAVAGTHDQRPSLAFPDREPPVKRQREVLHQGAGKAVSEGDLVVVDYLGQFWDGEVFDDSYTQPHPSAFTATDGSFFPGFAESVTGVPVGSRVLTVSPPPADAIKDAQALSFVVDVIATYDKTATGDPQAKPQLAPRPGPRIGGELAAEPKITLPAGLPEPTQVQTALLAAHPP